MGQKRPVQIVNLVSQGTIEEGMLSVLAFKRSLSAGILDGGEHEISLGGSRLNRFMKDVEKVTGRTGDDEAMTLAEEQPAIAFVAAEPASDISDQVIDMEEPDRAEPDRAEPQDANPDPWAALLQIGTQLASALTAADDAATASHPWIERHPTTGARSLRVPLPPPETARQLADALSALAQTLRGTGAGG